MAKDMMDSKHWMMHKRWMGVKMFVLGALILANMYWAFLNWFAFLGGVLVLWGLVEMIMPGCKFCK
jgi:uncharacterized membrane protein HdeD (DUF308 family)